MSEGAAQSNRSTIHWMAPDNWTEQPTPKAHKMARAIMMTEGCYDPKTYAFDSSFRPYDPNNGRTVHTSWELLEFLHNNPKVEIDAKVMGWDAKAEGWRNRRVTRETFLKGFESKDWDSVRFKEAVGGSTYISSPISPSFSVGNDFTPLLGGPFFKNLYYYEDYIRMHSEAFYAKNNDPVANAITGITKNFVLGTGYEVQCDTSTTEGQLAMAAWKAFEQINDLQTQIDNACEEISIYGEVMWWKLPFSGGFSQDKIIYRLKPGDTIPYGLIPRVRLLDPSNLVEIVTYPEDISRVLFYCWLTPTQWQIFTGGLGEGRPTQTNIQPSLKFIYRTIMADQVLHYKINTVTGEKRGRSDYFPIFQYLKRLRDTVDYQLIALQKAAAWAIDTTIDGDQSDILAYQQAMANLGTIPAAGSEFVHTKAIVRQMIANQGASNINSDAFALSLSMCAIGSTIPVSWFGTHLSGGSTRAGALVSTEPVVKKIEKRQEIMKRMITELWDYNNEVAGIGKIKCHVIFPEIISQDRSQKLKDLMLVENQRWLAPATVATIAAKEFKVENYDYNAELQKMKTELPEVPMPLTAPAGPTMGQPFPSSSGSAGGFPTDSDEATPEPRSSQLTSQYKRQVMMNDTRL